MKKNFLLLVLCVIFASCNNATQKKEQVQTIAETTDVETMEEPIVLSKISPQTWVKYKDFEKYKSDVDDNKINYFSKVSGNNDITELRIFYSENGEEIAYFISSRTGRPAFYEKQNGKLKNVSSKLGYKLGQGNCGRINKGSGMSFDILNSSNLYTSSGNLIQIDKAGKFRNLSKEVNIPSHWWMFEQLSDNYFIAHNFTRYESNDKTFVYIIYFDGTNSPKKYLTKLTERAWNSKINEKGIKIDDWDLSYQELERLLN